MTRGDRVARSLRLLARCWPRPVELNDGEAATADLRRALAYLDAGVDAETTLRAGNGAAAFVALVGLLAALLAPRPLRLPVAAAALAVALGVAHLARRGPVALAAARRTAALGTAPALVARAVLRTRVEPASERAAEFAARGEGRLAADLAEHVRRAEGTPRSGLAAFGADWADRNPPLRRAALLVESAADAPAGERETTLERAMDAILDGTRDRMAEFAEVVRGPTTALYAFGVLLPLALVAVLPAARVAGMPLSVPILVAVYDLLLPAALVAAGAWLAVRRPAAFPPPDVSRDHPAVPDRRWPAVAVWLGVGAVVLAFVAVAPLPRWTRWPAIAGGGTGAALVWWFRPVERVRDDARAVEANLTDALYLVGRRVRDGAAVESAIAAAAPEVAGRTGETLADAAGLQRRLRVGVREAFLGEYGALAEVPSPQARSVAALLALAAREGRPAGRAIVSMADHVDDLQRVEREARRELASVTGTLKNTAAVFGPLVGGATVALADGMAAGTLGDPLPTAALGVAVSTYVLLMAAVLTALATGLERGFDRALVGYRVGLALLGAVGSFLAGFVGAGFAA
ncbi:type II secretion system protein [Halorussus gelatinilyticus]|uniref:Type II secretion system protein n=1 Tax=Halorussus gelatinilyticus TaxID=2937524 RepID=A0A8U0IH02_9EURY|nr:type II secretion system protein [Halorussus gelatinilyticus]UPV99348.1 type II secretion system protein [Halorussus gelatinilyticus]